MTQSKCPGQDTRSWKPEDVSEVACPECGRKVEFFKDEARRKCRCGRTLINPKVDRGCAAWCKSAEECLGPLPEEAKAQSKQASARSRKTPRRT